jgi:hypothetical protein
MARSNEGENPLFRRLSAPARRALESAGISTVEHLAQHTRRDINALHGIGPLTMLQLDKTLNERGLRFKE